MTDRQTLIHSAAIRVARLSNPTREQASLVLSELTQSDHPRWSAVADRAESSQTGWSRLVASVLRTAKQYR